MNDELRDIKPLLEIADISYFIYVGLIFFVGMFLIVLFLLIGKRIWLTRKVNMKKVYFERLKNIDWKESKWAAYEVTFLGRFFLDSAPRVEEIYLQLLVMLEPYKYRKKVPKIDEMTLNQYHLLVHVIDESI